MIRQQERSKSVARCGDECAATWRQPQVEVRSHAGGETLGATEPNEIEVASLEAVWLCGPATLAPQCEQFE